MKAANIKSVRVGADGVISEVVYERDNKRCTYEKSAADEAGTYTITDAP